MQALPPQKKKQPLLLYVHLHKPVPLPPQCIHLPQLTTHSPNRFPSQVPTSRDPLLACPGLLRPRAKSKARLMDKGLLAVELLAVASHPRSRPTSTKPELIPVESGNGN